MGYSHYYKLREDMQLKDWKRMQKFVRRLIQEAPFLIVGPLGERNTKPVISAGTITFNGSEEESCETCLFYYNPDSTNTDHYCKTNGRNYDAAVVACLVFAQKNNLLAEHWRSDGDKEDHKEGKQLCAKITRLIDKPKKKPAKKLKTKTVCIPCNSDMTATAYYKGTVKQEGISYTCTQCGTSVLQTKVKQ